MKKEMTPRERVYMAMNLDEPDRVPISFDGIGGTGIVESVPDGMITTKLYEHLGIDDYEPIQISPVFNMVANVDERVKQRLRSDFRMITPQVPPPITEPDGTKTWKDLFGIRIKRTGYYDDPFDFPLRNATTKKDLDDYPYWPDCSIDITTPVIDKARSLHEETDYFIVARCVATWFPFPAYAFLCGIEKWLTDMKLNPTFYHMLCGRLLDYGLATIDQFFSSVGKYVDGVNVHDDLGTQTGGFFSLDDYREFYKPYTKAIIERIRKHIRPEAKIMLHSCGSVYSYLADLIEIGVQVLHPAQPLAKNMEPWRIKREFGDSLTVLGAFDIQYLLPLGTVDQVREGAKKLIREYASGGGYIFGPTHTIEPDTPPDNIVAAFDAAYEYGTYPISRQNGLNYVDYIKSLNLH